MKKILIYLLLLPLLACEEEDSMIELYGNFYSTSVIEDSPIRVFSIHGEVLKSRTVSRMLSAYNNETSLGDYNASAKFTKVSLTNDTINITGENATMKLSGTNTPYNFTINGNIMSVESKDTITDIHNFYEEDKQNELKKLGIYQAPDYEVEEKMIPWTTGFYKIYQIKYFDKKYIHIVNENTIRVPYVRFLFKRGDGFQIFPVEINNCFNEDNFGYIADRDTILIKEYEVEYQKK